MFGYFWERFWAFLNFENFLICKKIFEDSTLHGTLGKKFFRKFSPQHVQDTFGYFGNTFGHFWNFKNIFFENFRKLDPPQNTGQKNFSEKLIQNKFKTRLDTFGNDFGHFWNFAIFLIFLIIFEDSTFHGKLGKHFSKSLPRNLFKTRLDTFGNDFGRFRKFETFLTFFENVGRLDTPWNTGHKIFQKIFPKTCSKHVWILLGTLLGIFGILKIFFLKIFENSTLHGTLGKKIFEKFAPKHVQNTFAYFRERFCAFLEF